MLQNGLAHTLSELFKSTHLRETPSFAGKPFKASGSLVMLYDPQPEVVREQYPRTAMCVRNVNVHVSCSSHVDAQLAAFFIDPRAKWSTVRGDFIYIYTCFDRDPLEIV